MRITLIQSALIWHDPAANRARFDRKLADYAGQTDLILLPEMFNTGFTMNTADLAETMEGPTAVWMQESASKLDAAITGSFICVENGKYYNRLLFCYPDGRVAHYDKKHLFGLAGEDRHFSTNNKKLVLEWQGFRIRPLICYDLRFPVWSRNSPDAPYDLLLYVANWPMRRAHHWRSLLTARAIENQAFVAAVNVVGTDGAGLEYQGDSALIDYSGQHFAQLSNREGTLTMELSLEDLREYRRQLPFLSDADRFELL